MLHTHMELGAISLDSLVSPRIYILHVRISRLIKHKMSVRMPACGDFRDHVCESGARMQHAISVGSDVV